MLKFTMSVNEPRTPSFKIFADAVESHDGVVHRITDQGEQCRDDSQINLLIEEGEQANGDDGVVKDSNHGGDAINPFKAEGNVDQHGGEGDQNNVDGLLPQIGADLRSNDFYAADGEVAGLAFLLNHI